jgi:Raf kinase inhibitor-like YbhB/YbcL family protein
MQLRSDDLKNMQPIPDAFAFGQPGPNGEPCILSSNRNPHLAWSDIPPGTRSFALACIDTDVPTRGDDVNKPGRRVPASLPRTEFVHWLMADIPAACREIASGACSDGIVARGKRAPQGPAGAKQGLNDYSVWFADDADMAGDYLGYDGPCPPWNDEILHHYHFHVYALDLPTLALGARFTLADLRAALHGHVLAEAKLTGTYTLMAELRR